MKHIVTEVQNVPAGDIHLRTVPEGAEIKYGPTRELKALCGKQARFKDHFNRVDPSIHALNGICEVCRSAYLNYLNLTAAVL